MNRVISKQAWVDLAKALEVEEAALRAVAEVESAGSGFLSPPSDRPKILFEGHAFHRLTGGRFSAEHPAISYPKWDRSKYAGSLAGEWKRLEAACQLDRVAALQSASWGVFQIMGFNYPYCGSVDVEAFVAAQHEGADQQLSAFARFVWRPPFLAALRARNWAGFARAYNGPGYAKNRYDRKMADAYARWQAELAPASEGTRAGSAKKAARKRPSGDGKALPPGRESFPAAPVVDRSGRHRRNVRPDRVDLRDWVYRPSIAIAPPDTMLPHDLQAIKNQQGTNACTGFGLATVIEYLLDRGHKPVDVMSGYMLYSMARRYDEWAEVGEPADDGSSLRGALKGWSRHGASCDRLWCKLEVPSVGTAADENWWWDAAKRPMGAFYRISPECIRDMHIAINEVGAVYASAYTHAGWDELLQRRPQPAPARIADLPLIPSGALGRDLGHAFAIIGYTCDGFVVQNSWGPNWGRGGFAVLRYDDWRTNAMDCWVVQLGVVTAEHTEVANTPSLRVDKAGRALVSRNPVLAEHEVAPFVVNMENEGRLSERGRFRTRPDDLQALVGQHLPLACERWKQRGREHVDVAIYAHGGLTGEDAAAQTASAWVPHLYSNQIFPVFLMWETGALKTICNLFQDAILGEEEARRAGGERWDRFKDRFEDWRNERLEGVARLPGGKLWGEMKQNADALSSHDESGVIALFKAFKDARAKLPARIRLHLIGHSAGAIVHTWLGPRALAAGFELASISLMAPAVRLDLFDGQLGKAIASRKVPVLLANLTDATERADETCKPYGHSLLYLVARSFEDQHETPLLGMERHIVPALPTQAWGAQVRQLRSPGGSWNRSSAVTRAVSHGGLDNDPAVREAVTAFIRQQPG